MARRRRRPDDDPARPGGSSPAPDPVPETPTPGPFSDDDSAPPQEAAARPPAAGPDAGEAEDDRAASLEQPPPWGQARPAPEGQPFGGGAPPRKGPPYLDRRKWYPVKVRADDRFRVKRPDGLGRTNLFLEFGEGGWITLYGVREEQLAALKEAIEGYFAEVERQNEEARRWQRDYETRQAAGAGTWVMEVHVGEEVVRVRVTGPMHPEAPREMRTRGDLHRWMADLHDWGCRAEEVRPEAEGEGDRD